LLWLGKFVVFTFAFFIGWNAFTHFNPYFVYAQEPEQVTFVLNAKPEEFQEKFPNFKNIVASTNFEDSLNILSISLGSNSRNLFHEITSQSSGFPPTNSESGTSSGFPPTNSESGTSSGFPPTSDGSENSHPQGTFSSESGQQQSCTAFTIGDGPCNLKIICPFGCILRQPIIIVSNLPDTTPIIVPAGSKIMSDGSLKIDGPSESQRVGPYVIIIKE
jgi:hypothetical protein